jgi:hypothetical protein
MAVKKSFHVLLTAGCCLSMVGCVPHLSLQQCQSTNWYQMGLGDGSQGKLQRNLSRYISDCAKFNIPVKTHQYKKGWGTGVRRFCRAANGYRLGTKGETYHAICPQDLAASFKRSWRRGLVKYCVPDTGYNLGRSGKAMPDFCAPRLVVPFSNAYDSGRRVYLALKGIQDDINNANRDIADARLSIAQKEKEVRNWTSALTQPGSTGASRNALQVNITKNNDDIRDLNRRIDRLMSERSRLQVQLNRESAKG